MNDKLPDDFDPVAYLAMNPDVASAGMDPAEHYRRFGCGEGRIYNLKRATLLLPEGFDPDLYLKINPDVAIADQDPITHYLTYGRQEGRAYYRTTPFYDGPAVPTRNQFVSHKNLLSGQYHRACCPKVIAFYLPQFHQIAENDEWWGEGFTEWTNVKKAKPNLVGHHQPRIPLGGDYYDLSDIGVHKRQAQLADRYGIDAFCYYMYWFNGRRVLEKPLDLRLEDKTIGNKFCICWANENWTRRWDGRDNDVLLKQVHSAASDRQFIRDSMKYLSDPRYLRIEGKLLLLVYRVDLIPQCAETASIWREEVRQAGLGELHLCAVQVFGISDPRPFGFDAAVEFPPHDWFVRRNLPHKPHRIVNPSFDGHVFDYGRAVEFAQSRIYPDFRWYRGAFPSWDNTPRRQNAPHLFLDATPQKFREWLTFILKQQIEQQEPEHQLVFINAWNEWGEGAFLEPDETGRFAALEAVEDALAEVRRRFA